MPKHPENNPQSLRFAPDKLPSKQAIKDAVEKMNQDYAREIVVLRAKTPAWSPLMDQIIIGVPGQPSPEELEKR